MPFKLGGYTFSLRFQEKIPYNNILFGIFIRIPCKRN